MRGCVSVLCSIPLLTTGKVENAVPLALIRRQLCVRCVCPLVCMVLICLHWVFETQGAMIGFPAVPKATKFTWEPKFYTVTRTVLTMCAHYNHHVLSCTMH